MAFLTWYFYVFMGSTFIFMGSSMITLLSIRALDSFGV